MDIFKPFRRCFFCKKRGKTLEKIPQWGMYSTDFYFTYHPQCLKAVLCEPEKYGHEKVDRALQIAVLIEEGKAEEKKKRMQNIMKMRVAKEVCKRLYDTKK